MSCNGQCALRATVTQTLITPPSPHPKCEMKETYDVCVLVKESEQRLVVLMTSSLR